MAVRRRSYGDYSVREEALNVASTLHEVAGQAGVDRVLLADAVLDAGWAPPAEVERLREERQAVLDCINLYGDEILHRALDGIGWPHV